MVLLNLAAVVYPLKIHQLSSQHCWFSGRMLACHAGGPGSIPGQCRILNFWILTLLTKCFSLPCSYGGFHGVMVSTLDSESSDPSSNLGGTLLFASFEVHKMYKCNMIISKQVT